MKRVIPLIALTTLFVFSCDKQSYAYYNLGAFWRASSSSSGSISKEPWTVQDGTASGQAIANGIAVDSAGNSYVCGSTSVAGIDGNSLKGSTDLFISKYNTSGVRQWTVEDGSSGGLATAKAFGVAVDSSGNVYVTGETTNGLDGNSVKGSTDFFITKYNTLGVRQWTMQDGTSGGFAYGNGIAVDSSGNTFVTGYTYGAGLDGNTLKGTQDLFITEYNSSGTRQWTVEDGTSTANATGSGIAIDSSDNVHVTGYITGAGLDGNTLKGTQDLFITEYNSSGTRQWTVEDGTSGGSAYGNGIALDSSGDAYVAGYTSGAGLDGNTRVGTKDLIITKYNSSGTRQWTVEDGTSAGSAVGSGIAIDISGNPYATGYTSGAGIDGNTLKGTYDLFATEYNSSGTRQWTDEDGPSGGEALSNGIAIDSSGDAYLTGYVTNSGSGVGIDGNIMTGFEDIFIIKLSNATKLLTLSFSGVTLTSFTATASFAGDLNSSNSATIYYCDATLTPSCTPTSGTSAAMTRSAGQFNYSAASLNSGDTYNVEVVATDADGTYASPLTSSIVLATTCQFFLTSGSTWTVPSDWSNSNNKIEVIGAGGSGPNATAGAGGGGGGYAKATNVTLTAGASIAYSVGVGATGAAGGNTYFCNSTSNCASISGSAVVAGATGGGIGASGSPGSSGSGSVGAVLYSGGAGGTSIGGGAAGPSGSGSSTGTADSGTVSAGAGGAEWGSVGSGGGGAGAVYNLLTHTYTSAKTGANFGGGGGGGYSASYPGASGANGIIAVTYGGVNCGRVSYAKQIILTSGTTWTVPSDWNSTNNSIEVIGAGGGSTGSDGGGGGGYSRAVNVALTANSTVSYSVGAASTGSGGNTYICNSTSNCASISGSAVVAGANGGGGGSGAYPSSTAGAGGSTTGAVGSFTYSGGNGGNATKGIITAFPGGGGGAAGPFGAGSNSPGLSGGYADDYHVSGNASGTEWSASVGCGGGGNGSIGGGGVGTNGLNYGGGGSGVGGTNTSNGGPGLIVISYTP